MNEAYLKLDTSIEKHIARMSWVSRNLAEDFKQAAWVWLLQTNSKGQVRAETWDPSKGSLNTWAFGLARLAVQTAALAMTRHITRNQEVLGFAKEQVRVDLDTLLQVDPDPGEEDGETHALLLEAMLTLKKEDQEVLVLRAQGMPYAQIAKETGLKSHATARSRFLAARQRAKEALMKVGLGSSDTI